MMEETVSGGYIGTIWNPVFDRMLWARNLQGMQRLKDLAERQDLLLASSGRGVVGRRLLRLRRAADRSWYWTIVSYQTG